MAPTWILAEALPATIRPAIRRAFAIGIAYASDAETSLNRNRPFADAAVTMPTTRPLESRSGPPESPACTAASVSISPLSVS